MFRFRSMYSRSRTWDNKLIWWARIFLQYLRTGQVIEIQFRPFKWPQLSGCRTFPWTTPPAPPAISSYTNKPSQKLKTTPDCCSIQSGQTALLSTGESQHHQSAVSPFPTYTYPCALSTIFVMFPYFRLASNIDTNYCISSLWGVRCRRSYA